MDSKLFFHQLGVTLYSIDGVYTNYIKENNIKSSNELWILYALNDGHNHSQKEISDSWDIPRTTVNTIIKNLAKAGYVEFKKIEGERREMEVVLTETGKNYANSKLEDLYKKEAKIYQKIKNPDELLNSLKDLLDLLILNNLGGNKNE